MKCDLPLPKLPCRYVPLLARLASEFWISDSALSKQSWSCGVTTYSPSVTWGSSTPWLSETTNRLAGTESGMEGSYSYLLGSAIRHAVTENVDGVFVNDSFNDLNHWFFNYFSLNFYDFMN